MFSKFRPVLLLFGIILIAFACKESSNPQENAVESKVDSTQLSEVLEKTETDQPAETEERMTYTVSLGVMPDMNFEGNGVLIGHVNDGRPAHLAGIQKGDVVVQMGEQEVTDLVSYTKILGSFSKGDQVKVMVRRDDQLLTFLVEF